MQENSTRFCKGHSGNPAGRPKGSRNKLTEKFLIDIEKDWKKHGKDVLESVRVSNPSIYLKIVSDLIIKDDPIHNEANEHMSIEDARAELLRRLQARYPIEDDCQDINQELISS
jgi:hypothetical protein